MAFGAFQLVHQPENNTSTSSSGEAAAVRAANRPLYIANSRPVLGTSLGIFF